MAEEEEEEEELDDDDDDGMVEEGEGCEESGRGGTAGAALESGRPRMAAHAAATGAAARAPVRRRRCIVKRSRESRGK